MKLCGDCAVEEGQLHELGCDQERCRRCDRQLISCGCDLDKILDKDREPYLVSIFCCSRCCENMPELKMRSNEEWDFICGASYEKDCVLCTSCMDKIKKMRLNI